MDERVTVSVDGGIADVRLNRPDKLNGLDLASFMAARAGGTSPRDLLAREPGSPATFAQQAAYVWTDIARDWVIEAGKG